MLHGLKKCSVMKTRFFSSLLLFASVWRALCCAVLMLWCVVVVVVVVVCCCCVLLLCVVIVFVVVIGGGVVVGCCWLRLAVVGCWMVVGGPDGACMTSV